MGSAALGAATATHASPPSPSPSPALWVGKGTGPLISAPLLHILPPIWTAAAAPLPYALASPLVCVFPPCGSLASPVPPVVTSDGDGDGDIYIRDGVTPKSRYATSNAGLPAGPRAPTALTMLLPLGVGAGIGASRERRRGPSATRKPSTTTAGRKAQEEPASSSCPTASLDAAQEAAAARPWKPRLVWGAEARAGQSPLTGQTSGTRRRRVSLVPWCDSSSVGRKKGLVVPPLYNDRERVRVWAWRCACVCVCLCVFVSACWCIGWEGPRRRRREDLPGQDAACLAASEKESCKPM